MRESKLICTITDKDITGSEKLSSAKPRIAVGVILFDSDNNIALSHIGICKSFTVFHKKKTAPPNRDTNPKHQQKDFAQSFAVSALH